MSVTIIPATSPAQGKSATAQGPLRTAAYCRVSIESDEQEASYEAQCRHYTAYITQHAGWTLAGIFADEGISGTQARLRPEFLRMIRACEAGLVDQVITKSISRFARNTLDCLKYIRRLRELGIPIIFEKESINTMESSGEVLVTILASLAQQESASISANVRMGIEFGFQQGRGRLRYSTFLGYKRGEEPGSYVIVPDEAAIVRCIYKEYLEGLSPRLIAGGLMRDGVRAPAGGARWHASTVTRILSNEKYCGDLLMQKWVTEDYLTHHSVRNTGQRPQYFVEDDHDPIVPKPVFRMVQRELERRKTLFRDPEGLRGCSGDALCGRLVCDKCGRTLKRYTTPSGHVDWRCRKRAMKKHSDDCEQPLESCACSCRFVGDREARDVVVQAFNALPSKLDELSALANESVAVRALLELAECMAAGGDARLSTAESTCANEPAACRDIADFFCRTKYMPPSGALDVTGAMVRFDDALTARFVKHVVVHDEGYDVVFYAGVTVSVA